MSEERCCGGVGGLFGGNWTILFFILVFLLLFWDGMGFGGYGGCIDPK